MLVGSKECRLPRDGSLKAAARVRIPSGYTVGLHNNFHDDSRTCSSILADCLRTDAGLHATGRPATCGLAVPQRDSTCATASGARKPRAGGLGQMRSSGEQPLVLLKTRATTIVCCR
jgi:hypothetical protein